MYTGERQTAKMRIEYLRSLLNRDMAFFDIETTTGEVITTVTNDIIIIQDAISEKVMHVCFDIITYLVWKQPYD